METKIVKTNRGVALISGFSLLLMAILAGFAYGYIFQNFYVASSGATTLQNLNNSKILISLFLFSFVIILILDLVVSWSLYLFYKQVEKSLSLFSALFRLIYSALLGIALFNIFSVLQLLNNAPQNEIIIMTYFKEFLNVWSFGLIIFGMHLFLLSFLIFKSDFTPNILGALVLFASI